MPKLNLATIFISAIFMFGNTAVTPIYSANANSTCKEYKVRLSNQTGKEAASNVPSWALGQRPCKNPNESGTAFATRLLNAKYGAGNYATGPSSEFNQIKKFGDRGFQ